MGTTSYVSTTTLECEICGHKQRTKSYHDYVCEVCGQRYLYDNDCYRVELLPSQLELLRKQQFKTASDMVIDWKLKLMQVLNAVGQAEGVWFDPWPGITKEEQAEIEREYEIYSLKYRSDGSKIG